MLRERTDGPCSYVGHTGKIPEARLAEHNETFEKGRGADETRGKQWNICRVYMGFSSKNHANSFEETINANEVEHWTQRLKVIESVWKLDKLQFVQEDVGYTDDDI